MLLCLDSHRHKDPVEVIVNQFATDYLVKIIQEERLEEARQARRARLARSVAPGRRRDTPGRFSLRRALGRRSRVETAPG